jgi:hypothetical protein
VHSKTKYVQNKNSWEVYCIKQTSQKVKGGNLRVVSNMKHWKTLEKEERKEKILQTITNNNAINA